MNTDHDLVPSVFIGVHRWFRQTLVKETAMLTHLYDIVRQRAEAYPDAVALGAQEGLGWRTVTSRQLLDLTDRLASELAALGVREGDRIVLWVPNHWRTGVYCFACW